jgi:pyruvate dehydrogenase E1 component alpha subunit
MGSVPNKGEGRQLMSLSDAQLIEMLKRMVTIRLFEEAVREAYTKGWMPGLAHLYTGQEAVAVGSCFALKEDDWITSTHRGHGHLIAKGAKLEPMMAEIMGKVTGYCRGKGGSQHITDPAIGILGANGIVGGSLAIAAGAALTSKMTGSDRVCLSFFGDGAANQGIFHEALNMASTWHLPVVYICENNLYGMGVSTARAMNISGVSARAGSYGIPGITIDGNDVIAVHECVLKAVDRARAGEGPTLVECLTYRWYGHNVGDPGVAYRSRDESEEWRSRCPIKRLRGLLLAKGCLSEEAAMAIESEVGQAVSAAVSFARESAYPDFSELERDVYVDAWDWAR